MGFLQWTEENVVLLLPTLVHHELIIDFQNSKSWNAHEMDKFDMFVMLLLRRASTP